MKAPLQILRWLVAAIALAACAPATAPAAEALRPEAKILDGRRAEDGTHPWMVAILHAGGISPFQAQFCGGVLIDPYWVLTAAHCVAGRSADDLEVGVGFSDLRGVGGIRIGIAEIIRHPNYRENPDGDLFDDVALIRLERPAEVAELPLLADAPAQIAPGRAVRAYGWGALSASGRYPRDLREVDLKIVDIDLAQIYYGGSLVGGHLAAADPDGDGDTCSGDSGGPLVTFEGGQVVVVGIVSYGFACGVTESPGIYADIHYYRGWIESAIAGSGTSYLGGEAVDTGGGWLVSPWFGSFNTRSYPWVYHEELGWVYLADDDYRSRPVGKSGIWFWDSVTRGWLWSAADDFPWAYADREGFIYFLFNGAPTEVYEQRSGKWETR